MYDFHDCLEIELTFTGLEGMHPGRGWGCKSKQVLSETKTLPKRMVISSLQGLHLSKSNLRHSKPQRARAASPQALSSPSVAR